MTKDTVSELDAEQLATACGGISKVRVLSAFGSAMTRRAIAHTELAHLPEGADVMPLNRQIWKANRQAAVFGNWLRARF